MKVISRRGCPKPLNEFWWYESDDAFRMLQELWRIPHTDVRQLKQKLHLYYLACCRGIWDLLPQEDSRWGIDTGERYAAGEISDEELSRINHAVEGAAFQIDYNCEPAKIEQWVKQTERMPDGYLRTLLHPRAVTLDIEPRDLLKRAAYFADFAMVYPRLSPGGVPPEPYAPFLSAPLLRRFVGNPFRSECCP